MKIQIGCLTIIVESMDELDQLVQRYGGAARAEVSVHPAGAGVEFDQTRELTGQPKTKSPLETRLDELQDQHGPVFVIGPLSIEVGPGQKTSYGTPARTVEVLESAELVNKSGEVVRGRWFAKLVDV